MKTSYNVLKLLAIIQFVAILVMGYFLFLADDTPNSQVTESGCVVYDHDYIAETYQTEIDEGSDNSEFNLVDVIDCVRPGNADDLDPWADQVLNRLNLSGAIDFDTFAEAKDTPFIGADIYVANEDFTIVPLTGAEAVTWVCPEGIDCTWSPEILGHSTIYYFSNGVPVSQ